MHPGPCLPLPPASTLPRPKHNQHPFPSCSHPPCRELPPQLSCMQQLETLRVSTAGTLQLSSRQLPALLRKLPCLTRLELGGHPGNLKPGLERAAAKLPQLQLELA